MPNMDRSFQYFEHLALLLKGGKNTFRSTYMLEYLPLEKIAKLTWIINSIHLVGLFPFAN